MASARPDTVLVLEAAQALAAGPGLVLAPGAVPDFFDDFLPDAHAPELVIHVLTCEAGALADPLAAAPVGRALRRYPQARHCIVGLACLGLYAAIQHMANARAGSAIIQVVEAPRSRAQAMLDALGMGDGGDGMAAEEGVACLRLRRKAREEVNADDIVIAACEIVAKPQGTAGSVEFMGRMAALLRRGLPDGGPLVSFAIASPWSRRLHGWFEREVQPRLPGLELLDSCETGAAHSLSVKPVLEIQRYREVLQQRGTLALATLGAGGRFGFLRLSRGYENTAALPYAETVTRPPVVLTGDGFTVPPQAHDYLFAAPPWRGLDNLYFHWPIQL